MWPYASVDRMPIACFSCRLLFAPFANSIAFSIRKKKLDIFSIYPLYIYIYINHPNQLINVILSSKNEKSNRCICLIHGSFLHRVPCKQNIAATTSDERMPIPYLIPRSTTILGFEQYIYVCIPLNGSCVVHSRTKAMCLLGSHGVCAMYDV